jgi:hypothetical protein
MSFFSTFSVFTNISDKKQGYKYLKFSFIQKPEKQKSPLNRFKGLCKILTDLKQ